MCDKIVQRDRNWLMEGKCETNSEYRNTHY